MEPTSSAWRASVALGVPPHFAISIYEDTLRTAEASIDRIRTLLAAGNWEPAEEQIRQHPHAYRNDIAREAFFAGYAHVASLILAALDGEQA